MNYKKQIKKLLVLLFTAIITVSASGFFITYHECHECGTSDFYFLKKTDFYCAKHNKELQNQDLCCSPKSEINHNDCQDCCKNTKSYFTIPFYPIQQTFLLIPFEIFQAKALISLENLFSEFNTELLQKTVNPPPLLLSNVNFTDLSQQRIFYH